MEMWERSFNRIPLLCICVKFYTDRSYHLAQIKYLLMLRWRRFCRHTSVIEKLYPHYKVTIPKINMLLYWYDLSDGDIKFACKHLSGLSELSDLFSLQDQVSYLMSEYEDAVQRARRLSASREKILSGRGNSANLLTQDDMAIYLRWLVCHLHSVQPVHNFLRVTVHPQLQDICRFYYWFIDYGSVTGAALHTCLWKKRSTDRFTQDSTYRW